MMHNPNHTAPSKHTRERFQLKETIVTITSEKKYMPIAKRAIKSCRHDLERFIRRDPFFASTIEEYACPDSAPEIAVRMADASNTFGIGPMSAVAGTIAAVAVEAMVDAGATYAIVDNGGDIALVNDETIIVGIYAGRTAERIGLEIEPRDSILGICTSSGRIGHSISFGNADAATIISGDVSLADAAATAVGNAVSDVASIEDAFSILKGVGSITGCLILLDGNIGLYGSVPVVEASQRVEYITGAWA
jgi:ApbE superfamily uncharacterized protein (UPF0280 family)